ncbi:MAG: helix-turn-helix domain-containing protein [Acidobacteriota bacterium]|nr:helix-turn-helix domain-containing protein [Acidobacteriota bacterium]
MSITLGEKLRQAREAQGLSISQVAEQTRISALYLSCIENEDFRVLPGGIFNKGFVKSFAKAVGVDEQEALHDYAQLVTNQGGRIDDNLKTYRPQVLTDDRSSSSMFPTVIFAAVILGLMTLGILVGVKYIQQTPPAAYVETNSNTNGNLASNLNYPPNSNVSNANISTQPSLSMNNLTVGFKALNSPVYISLTTDGKEFNGLIRPDQPSILKLTENLKLSYSKSQAQNLQMTINGKQISLPSKTENSNKNVIRIEIDKSKIQEIWESGKINSAAPTAPR